MIWASTPWNVQTGRDSKMCFWLGQFLLFSTMLDPWCYLLLRELKDQREYIHQRLSQTKDSLCPKSLKLLRRKVSLEVKPAVGIKPLAQHSHCKHTHHFPVWLASAIFFESLISSHALDNFSLPKISLRQQCFYFICNSIRFVERT